MTGGQLLVSIYQKTINHNDARTAALMSAAAMSHATICRDERR
jgi:hypothetical protein